VGARALVPNLDEAMASAKANGWKVVGVNKQSPSWLEAFIHPKQVLANILSHHISIQVFLE